jgi:Tol biopolymer transport system component
VYGLNGDLYVRDSPSAAPRLLLGGPGEQAGVIYSHDGQLIAYDNVVDGVDHVAVANADGSNPRIILEEPFTGGTATWSPDGRWMALGTGDADKSPKLWIAASDGSGARELRVAGLGVLDAEYNPADDGTLLVRATDGTAVDVYLVDLEGTVLHTYDVDGDMVMGPYWEMSGLGYSPDGRTIASNSVERYPATGNGRFRTYLMNADGTNRRLLPEPPGVRGEYHQAWPRFSPDGKWIALETWVWGSDGSSTNQLGIAPADGSAPPRLLGPQLPNQSIRSTWAPDSSRVLFAANDANLVWSADPVTGETERLPWNSELPDWQRRAP